MHRKFGRFLDKKKLIKLKSQSGPGFESSKISCQHSNVTFTGACESQPKRHTHAKTKMASRSFALLFFHYK